MITQDLYIIMRSDGQYFREPSMWEGTDFMFTDNLCDYVCICYNALSAHHIIDGYGLSNCKPTKITITVHKKA